MKRLVNEYLHASKIWKRRLKNIYYQSEINVNYIYLKSTIFHTYLSDLNKNPPPVLTTLQKTLSKMWTPKIWNSTINWQTSIPSRLPSLRLGVQNPLQMLLPMRTFPRNSSTSKVMRPVTGPTAVVVAPSASPGMFTIPSTILITTLVTHTTPPAPVVEVSILRVEGMGRRTLAMSTIVTVPLYPPNITIRPSYTRPLSSRPLFLTITLCTMCPHLVSLLSVATLVVLVNILSGATVQNSMNVRTSLTFSNSCQE